MRRSQGLNYQRDAQSAPNMHEFMKITSGTPPLCVMRSLTLDEGGSQLDKSQAIKARKLKHTAKLLFADDSCNVAADPEKQTE